MEYVWYNNISKIFMERGYLLPGQTLDERVDVICNRAQEILKIDGFAKQFKENIKKGWYSLSTPVWTNYGTDRGLPISCFGSYIEDDMKSILYTQAEVGMMTKLGGGTSAYFGKLRPRGSEIRNNGNSYGPVHFMRLFDNIVDIISQGGSRKGNFAAYLDIDHPDIEEFLDIKSEGNPIQNLFFGVCVTDEFMDGMIAGDIKKRNVWAKVLKSRANTGLPYISFIDNINNDAPDCYIDNNLKISANNLCSEINLFSDVNESFVCCLSSMNILHYDEWKDTNAVELLIYFLDSVITEFIKKAENISFMERTVQFAKNQRALGLGWLGWHSYLQSKMIPFESMEAKMLNVEIAKNIKDRGLKASKQLAERFGEPKLLRGYGRRNSTLFAIAPTKSSSAILGQVSEGIEPIRSNYMVKDLAKGKFSIKNIYLQNLLAEKGVDNDETWGKILSDGGSVQKLKCLSQKEKDVFKTFAEISPMEIIIQASQRQKYVDQGQSLNLMIHPSIPIKDVNKLIIEAWRLGIKSLYYQINVNAVREFSKNILQCSSCES